MASLCRLCRVCLSHSSYDCKFVAKGRYLSFDEIIIIQTVFVYGTNHKFAAFNNDCGFSTDCVPLQLTPPSWFGVAQWFGITAFLFCVHSMVRQITNQRPFYNLLY